MFYFIWFCGTVVIYFVGFSRGFSRGRKRTCGKMAQMIREHLQEEGAPSKGFLTGAASALEDLSKGYNGSI